MNTTCHGCHCLVSERAPYFCTPCGAFCNECMVRHVLTCDVCHDVFRSDFPEERADNSDRDDHNPVDADSKTWTKIYSKMDDPEGFMEHDHSMD